jgi:hypothetical protein
MASPNGVLAVEFGEARRDPTIAAAYLLAGGALLEILGSVAFTIYVSSQVSYGLDGDRLLAQTLATFSFEAVPGGLFALASLFLGWFSVGSSDAIGSAGHPGLRWSNAALGSLVLCCGLAGVAGAGLYAALPTSSSGWYVFEQMSQGIGAAMLGAAVVICTTLSARQPTRNERLPAPGAPD